MDMWVYQEVRNLYFMETFVFVLNEQCLIIPRPANLVTFTEEILYGKLYF